MGKTKKTPFWKRWIISSTRYRSSTLSTITVVLARGKFSPDDHRELNVPNSRTFGFQCRMPFSTMVSPKKFNGGHLRNIRCEGISHLLVNYMPRSNKTPEEHAREKWARRHATLKRFAALRSAEERVLWLYVKYLWKYHRTSFLIASNFFKIVNPNQQHHALTSSRYILCKSLVHMGHW
jgi:hypothetical protein